MLKNKFEESKSIEKIWAVVEHDSSGMEEEWTTYFTNYDEAVDNADMKWSYLTAREKKQCSVMVVEKLLKDFDEDVYRAMSGYDIDDEDAPEWWEGVADYSEVYNAAQKEKTEKEQMLHAKRMSALIALREIESNWNLNDEDKEMVRKAIKNGECDERTLDSVEDFLNDFADGICGWGFEEEKSFREHMPSTYAYVNGLYRFDL